MHYDEMFFEILHVNMFEYRIYALSIEDSNANMDEIA